MRQEARLLICGVVFALALSACTGATVRERLMGVAPTPTLDLSVPAPVLAQVRDFDFATKSLRDLYLDESQFNQDWERAVQAGRQRILQGDGRTIEPLVEAIQGLFDVLEHERLALLPPPQPPDPAASRYSGIGVLVDLPREGKDRILVLHVYPDSPAEKAGIRPHDAIIAIEGEPVTFEERDQLIPRLRGESGSKVTVTVRTPGQSPREVTLTRQPVDTRGPLVARWLLNTNIAYIAPNPSVLSTLPDDIAQALRKLNEEIEIGGLVLDLRVIRGDEFPLEPMLTLFVNGRVGKIKTRQRTSDLTLRGRAIVGSQEIPMVILVSELTAGPAEVFAGLLQDAGRARVVGVTTQGLTEQVETVTLPASRARLAIPVGEYLGLKGSAWRGKGVTPNPMSDRAWEDFSEEDDPHLRTALRLFGVEEPPSR
ncbi:MAG: S41 family peptidase [Anaerolineae bacterium]|nr:S41 family peptidase [Thermoflexales bacterium]MDW8396778.1 S41 family peptidase [Anaerolineae bacterium]